MGDDDHRRVLDPPAQGRADPGVGFGVHRGQAVVKDHHRGAPGQHPGDGHPLLLAPRQGNPPLADDRIVAIGEALDCLVHHGHSRGAPQFRQFQPRLDRREVIPDGLGEEEGLLEAESDMAAQVGPGNAADVNSINGDEAAPVRQVVEAAQKVRQGGFARAGGAQNRQGCAGFEGKRNVPQHRLPVPVGEIHPVKADFPPDRRGQSAGRVFLRPGLENFPDAPRGHQGLGEFREQPPQLSDRPDHPVAVGVKGQEGSRGKFTLDAPPYSRGHDDGQLQAAHKVPGPPEEAQHLPDGGPYIREGFGLLRKALHLPGFPAKGPDHPDAGVVLLGASLHGPFRGVSAGEFLAHPPEVENREEQDHRNQGQGGEGHEHVHGKHHGQGNHKHAEGPQEFAQVVLDEAADGVHVGGTALDDVPGLAAHVPVVGQALDVGVEAVPQLPGDGFSDFKARIAPDYVQEPGAEGRRQGEAGADPQVLPQKGQAAQGFGQVQHKGRRVQGDASNHRVDGVADDLGADKGKSHHAEGRKAAEEKTETPVFRGGGSQTGPAPLPG